ncbi:MAG: adenylosuccinate synthase [Bacteroidia bacterium]|nr:adenylosuccinate synthase [Bacteroidia bacterium]
MPVDVLLGLQWGDEGKGKIVDVLAPHYDVVARFQGGPNAGHTLEFNGKRIVLHTIPSGIFRSDVVNIVGNGVVIDPVTLKKEIEFIRSEGVNVSKQLFISRKAHLILPTHRMLDAASEALKGKSKIGSTLRGIGPAYMDKTGRNGLRAGDIESKDFLSRYKALTEKHAELLSFMNYESEDAEGEKEFFEGVELLRSLRLVDSEIVLNQYLKEGKKILAEGAQGSLLDIDFGSYPYVTSSSTITAGACTGLGIPPTSIRNVIGIFKAYCTRVGSGPFPSELLDETGERLRKQGNEFGSTTGRPRRCGWIDIPALRYAVMINGITHLAMMKSDVLCGFENVGACTDYIYLGEKTGIMPFDIVHNDVQPVFEKLPGWNKIESEDSKNLSPEFSGYVAYLEKNLGVKIAFVSTGPGREEVIVREEMKI